MVLKFGKEDDNFQDDRNIQKLPPTVKEYIYHVQKGL